MSQSAGSGAALAALLRLLVLVAIVAALGGCLPAHVRGTESPVSSPRASATAAGGAYATPAADANRVEVEPTLDASDAVGDGTFRAYAVTKPEIRDRAFDWDLQLEGLLGVYDGAAPGPALSAAADDLLDLCREQKRWLGANTGYDPSYEEPVRLWGRVVDGFCAGAKDVVRGVDRADRAVVRKGRKAIQAARDLMTSDEYFGA